MLSELLYIANEFHTFMQYATPGVEKIILGNKCDLEQLRVISTERGRMVSFSHVAMLLLY